MTVSLALASEPTETGIMSRPPRPAAGSLLEPAFYSRIIWVSVLIAAATIGVFFFEQSAGATDAQAQTTAVTMLTLSQLAYLFNSRFLRASSLRRAVLSGNRAVWVSTGTLLVLQLCFVYTPLMNRWFYSAPIGIQEWAHTLAVSGVIFLLVELIKAFGRRREEHRLRSAGGWKNLGQAS